MPVPRVLSIAGSDPSGGAGIQADLKAFHAQRVYGMAVLTALTAQNTRGVTAVHVPPVEFVRAQLDAVFDDCPPVAVKTGMLATREIVETVAAALRDYAARRAAPVLVVDPVMVATSGDRLLRADAVAAVRAALLPLARIVTPNRAELEVLVDERLTTADELCRAARSLLELGPEAVLVTGGDDVAGAGARARTKAATADGASPDEAVDWLVRRDGVERLALPRVAVAAAHGTGCTLSAVLAARLALGDELRAAVRVAKAVVHAGLVSAFPVGGGAVPVNLLPDPAQAPPPATQHRGQLGGELS